MERKEKKEKRITRTFTTTKYAIGRVDMNASDPITILETGEMQGKCNIAQVTAYAKKRIKELGDGVIVLPNLEYEDVTYGMPISAFLKHAEIIESSDNDDSEKEGE